MKTPYKPQSIPIHELKWEEMIPLIGMAQAAVARFDGILQSMVNVTKADFVKRTGIPERTAERLIPELEKARILRIHEQGAGRRPTVWAFQRLIAITERKEFG